MIIYPFNLKDVTRIRDHSVEIQIFKETVGCTRRGFKNVGSWKWVGTLGIRFIEDPSTLKPLHSL